MVAWSWAARARLSRSRSSSMAGCRRPAWVSAGSRSGGVPRLMTADVGGAPMVVVQGNSVATSRRSRWAGLGGHVWPVVSSRTRPDWLAAACSARSAIIAGSALAASSMMMRLPGVTATATFVGDGGVGFGDGGSGVGELVGHGVLGLFASRAAPQDLSFGGCSRAVQGVQGGAALGRGLGVHDRDGEGQPCGAGDGGGYGGERSAAALLARLRGGAVGSGWRLRARVARWPVGRVGR